MKNELKKLYVIIVLVISSMKRDQKLQKKYNKETYSLVIFEIRDHSEFLAML